MNFARLEKNLIDNIKEAQIKLGWDDRPMSLNYMNTSLANILDGKFSENDLAEFCRYSEKKLDKINIRPIKDGYCFTISAKGMAYVNSLNENYGFITELIETVRNHCRSIEDAIAVFRRYSENIAIEDGDGEEFDCLVYFADGIPDEYVYCLTAEPCIEGCHIAYHRFIREDFHDIFG